jgi:hypothetical protein
VPSDRSLPPFLPRELKPTRYKTLALFQAGKSLDEIAAERGMARKTIETHIYQLVQGGQIPIGALMSPEVIDPIATYFRMHPGSSSTQALEYFGSAFGLTEIMLVRAHIVLASAADKGFSG